MGKTIISADGRFEWDEDKDRVNIKNHGFSFHEILEIFDDPAFLEGYDEEHSDEEERYYGIGCLNNIVYAIVFYT
ncbi:MAG: BrnT family toxin, partial [Treponema sp.]|nr:BrnT family toxin [Treponema sp.]